MAGLTDRASTAPVEDIRRAADRDEICRVPRRLLQEHAIRLTGGHFDLGGRCSTEYRNAGAILSDPFLIGQLAQALIDLYLEADDVDVVAGPLTGGALLAHSVATILSGHGKRGSPHKLFVPLHPDADRYTIRPTFAKLLPGKRVWIVDDVSDSGNTLAWCGALVVEAGGEVVATSVILQNRRGMVIRDPALKKAKHSWIDLFDSTSVVRKDCPQCAAGVPFTKF